MRKLLTIEELLNLSSSINEKLGNDFDKNILTLSFTLNDDDLNKINEELFYRTRTSDDDVLSKANIVKAKINGINFEFKPD